MKTNNKHNEGFFARLLMALTIIVAITITDCTVAQAAEPATGIQITVLGDLNPVIKRGQNYVDPGFMVVNEKGQELPDLTSKVVTKFYEIRQVDGKWQEVLLTPFDTNRIAKIKVQYLLEEEEISAERNLEIVDQFDPVYDTWAKGQIAAQQAYADKEKMKGITTSTTTSTTASTEEGKDKGRDKGKNSGKTGGSSSSSSTGGGGNSNNSGTSGQGGSSTGGGGGNLSDSGTGGQGGASIGGGGGNLSDSGTGSGSGTSIGGN